MSEEELYFLLLMIVVMGLVALTIYVGWAVFVGLMIFTLIVLAFGSCNDLRD
jgi:hypothetical protein